MAKISGVPEAIANLTENGVVEPMIKTTIALSKSGFVSIVNASAFGVVKRDSTEGEEWHLSGISSGGSTSTGADSQSTVLVDEIATSEDPLTPPGLQVTIPLTVDLEFGFTPPMTDEEKQAARDRWGWFPMFTIS